jgi:hypothetical protein
LTLGASTSNEIAVQAPEEPDIDLSWLDDQEIQEFQQLLEKAKAAPINGLQ